MNLKFIGITIIVVVISPVLLWIKANPILKIHLFQNEQYNAIFNYQLTTLILAGAMIALVALLTNGAGLKYLKLNNFDGKITPEPWIGINPKKNESWKSLGLNFAFIITLVTAVVIFFQIMKQGKLSIEVFPGLLLVIVFALSNSFIEEILYRFSFVSVGMHILAPILVIQGLSALTFGGIHYFGNPSGIPDGLPK